jgi:hypothetical protein
VQVSDGGASFTTSSLSSPALFAKASAASGYSGTVLEAVAASPGGSGFYLFKVKRMLNFTKKYCEILNDA